MTTNVLNYSALIERETALEKKRASALARQQWATAIELEARIDECKLWRKKLAEVKDAPADFIMENNLLTGGMI